MAKGVMIKPDILKWAINASGMTIAQLSEEFPQFLKGLTEDVQFTATQLNKLSKRLDIPFGYFFLSKPPIQETQLLKFRTVDNLEHERPSRELIDTIKEMEKKQLFMREAAIDDGFSELEFVRSITINDSVEEVAENIRKTLGLKLDWNKKNNDIFNLIKTIISNSRILVMQNGIVKNSTKRSLDVSEFRAFVLVDSYAPLIFLNSKDSLNGKIFSLCHELVHIWLGQDELYNDNGSDKELYLNQEIEVFCNKVASELVLPKQLITYNDKVEPYDNVKNISTRFNVSDLVACLSLKNQGFISTRVFNSLYFLFTEEMKLNLLEKEKRSSSGGGDYYATQNSRLDKNFVITVNKRAKEGRILYTEAYDLIGAKGKTYDNLLSYMEGR